MSHITTCLTCGKLYKEFSEESASATNERERGPTTPIPNLGKKPAERRAARARPRPTREVTSVASESSSADEVQVCPSKPRHDGDDMLGCGQQFAQQPDEEGYVDCPHCGLVFKPALRENQ